MNLAESERPRHMEMPVLRVGAVNYLNTKPLIERLSDFAPNIELSLDLPSALADRLAAGRLDVGLIPVVEFFRGDPRGQVGIFSTSQFVSLLVAPLSAVMLVLLSRRDDPRRYRAAQRVAA